MSTNTRAQGEGGGTLHKDVPLTSVKDEEELPTLLPLKLDATAAPMPLFLGLPVAFLLEDASPELLLPAALRLLLAAPSDSG